MNQCSAILGLAAIALGASATFAAPAKDQGASPHAGESATVALDPKDVVAARQATFFLSTQAIGQIKAGLAEGGDLTRTAGAARMLADWAGVLPAMFPVGSDVEGSRALYAVWSDRAGFKVRAAAYREAALELAKLAGQGNREDANKAFLRMAGTCQACHETYREE